MVKTHNETTPKQDGFWMPGEYSAQKRIWMIWPERPDNWRNGAKPVQHAFVNVAKAIQRFTPVTMVVSKKQYQNCRMQLPETIQVVEMSSNDAWMRDVGPSFLVNQKGEKRAVDWQFNAWGGLLSGLYFPWDQDDLIAQKICELTETDRYRTDDFVLEGGAFHVDGEGTVLTTEMCLLNENRNPHLTKGEIETYLKDFLNVEKVLWLKDGVDPEETSGHVDDIACFIRPGEVACLYTEDQTHPFYQVAQATYQELSAMVDAKGRHLKVHKICCPKIPVVLPDDIEVDKIEGTMPRIPGDICIASYLNFLITNQGVIVPQYRDEHDGLALKQIQALFPKHEVVGVDTLEVVYGGGNIHCITQQEPL
ncbi:agmatine deiminase [Vagococcus silagei]|uniref:Putative agmatine deiminase n=1 Tax=Vagococcus silagei TaxID=2508885 RepID=A0A4S3B2S5_9ENTE|nr:agmatine deiminase [Vagococcus silagei]THB60708.1 agmatine deiminase [Vagococcus silagei]